MAAQICAFEGIENPFEVAADEAFEAWGSARKLLKMSINANPSEVFETYDQLEAVAGRIPIEEINHFVHSRFPGL